MKFIQCSLVAAMLATSVTAFAGATVSCPGANLVKKSNKLLDTVSIFQRRGPSDYNVLSFASLHDTNYDWHVMTIATAKSMDAALSNSQDVVKSVANSLNETAIEMNGALICGYDTTSSPMTPSIFAIAMTNGMAFQVPEELSSISFK